jgi:prepilin-type N-terminal cleavage/methylation domain-containing protein
MMINRTKGFTLVELLLAAAIMATTIVTILYIFTGCSFLVEEYRNNTIAINYARLIMEEIKNASYISLASAQSIGNLISSGDANVTVSFSGTNPLNVLVTVNYKNRRQLINPNLAPASVSLRSYMTNE